MIGNDGPFYVDFGDRKCLRQANQVRENPVTEEPKYYPEWVGGTNYIRSGSCIRISSLMVIGDTIACVYWAYFHIRPYPTLEGGEILRNSEDKSFRQL